MSRASVGCGRWSDTGSGGSKAKGPGFPPALGHSVACVYSRLPMKLSMNMNMLMKSRYRFSAPMMAALPSQS